MKLLSKVALASSGMGLAMLLAGGSVGDGSAPEKRIQTSFFSTSIPDLAPEKIAPQETPGPNLPTFASVILTNGVLGENPGVGVAISTGGINDERRQIMISRLQTIAK